ncbi:TetR family transcriptional regulator [Rhodococcus opacus RKJ300 = JCM 13270]|uniref:TetR family transcriptional regulator n=1 Tax=Rhodococcus opacus RKJ300 = JCM 13270 TaxID=1165867 RepID=I0WN89_RHOOP|nr:TetR family transcriptional regulator [Rhodococcus opacus RKJ300 = JCM 13270]
MADVPAPRATRPGRGRDPGGDPITRQRVLACALGIVDRSGIDGLSMRRLGKALGRDPMALYRHAPSKAALLDALAERVLEQFEVDIGDVDWATQLREVARGFRRLALAHPQMVPLLVTRPLSTPLGLRPLGTVARSRYALSLSIDGKPENAARALRDRP